MATKAEEIKKNIAAIQKQIDKPGTSEAVKKSLGSALTNAKAELEKAEAKEKTPQPKTPATEKPKPVRKKAEKKPAEKKEEKEEPHIIEVFHKGKLRKFDLNNCEEAQEGLMARIERDKESNKQTKSRLPVTAAVKSIGSAAGHIVDMIPAKAINDNPAEVAEILQEFLKGFDKAADKLKKIGISEASINKMKDAWDAIEEEIKALNKKAKEQK